MKKIFLITILLSYINSVTSQTSSYSFKEYYDKIYSARNYYPTPSGDRINCHNTGNTTSWVLMSLLKLYQTTGDLAQVEGKMDKIEK